jgi:hypothetical protein
MPIGFYARAQAEILISINADIMRAFPRGTVA